MDSKDPSNVATFECLYFATACCILVMLWSLFLTSAVNIVKDKTLNLHCYLLIFSGNISHAKQSAKCKISASVL